jgi:hypothetical protein
MNTRHSTWRLFAAFDLFVHVDPNIFCEKQTNVCMAKDEQLAALAEIVSAVAQFAGCFSR